MSQHMLHRVVFLLKIRCAALTSLLLLYHLFYTLLTSGY
jgi:hypothetical protein